MGKYTLEVGAPNSSPQIYDVDSIAEAREIAEGYDNTMDWANVTDSETDDQVASFRRDNNGDGMTWFDAEF